MSFLRRQLPVYSPLPLAALAAGVRSMLGRHADDEQWVRATLLERWAARDVLLTDSGTSALALALLAAERLRSSPVALPAFCCYDIATAADGAEVPTLLYDLDPISLGPNFNSLRRVLEQGARAVVVVHLYGVPVDMERVRRLAGEYRAFVIEDAAQGAGVLFGGRPAGALGALGVLSFGRGKGITGGGGGALLANDESGILAIETIRREVGTGDAGGRALVASLAQWLLARPGIYAVPAGLPFLGLGETVYQEPGPICGPSHFSSGVLRRTWGLAAAESETRRANAERLLAAIGAGSNGGVRPVRGHQGAVAGYLRLPVLAATAERRRALERTGRRLGVMPSYPRSLADLEGFGERVLNRGEGFPGARFLAECLLTLPTHGRVSGGDLERLVAWIERAGR